MRRCFRPARRAGPLWTQYQVDAGGDGDYSDAADLDQSRMHNVASEIYNSTAGAAITEAEGQSAWAEEHHDAAGNPASPLLRKGFGGLRRARMTGVPQPSDMTGQYTCVCDARNRLAAARKGEQTSAGVG